MTSQNNLLRLWKSHNANFVMALLLIIFTAYSLFLAFNLQPGIIPDEPAHIAFSKHFSTTIGIPPDTFETYKWGWYIEQNPFLFYWLNGRYLNIIDLVAPQASDREILVILRVINTLYALGTLIFCYLLSKEVLQHRWWQIFPVFLLTNTLMFVFLSAGVNYDNLANLFSMASLYFLVRVLKGKRFMSNSLMWILLIGLGTLTKYTILPLALAMTITWVIHMIIRRRTIFPLKFSGWKTVMLIIIVLFVLVGNILIYGVNILQYQSITPPCREILLEAQCEISPYEKRSEAIANNPKMTVEESIAEGFPSPQRYAAVDWVKNMLLRTFGMIGHKSYFPLTLIAYYQVLVYGMLVLGLINLLHYRKIPYIPIILLLISAFYAAILLYQNYQSELLYDFQHIAMQGRYIFPVIGLLYILLVYLIKWTPSKLFRWLVLIFIVCLFLIGGPFVILRGYDTIFSSWFVS